MLEQRIWLEKAEGQWRLSIVLPVWRRPEARTLRLWAAGLLTLAAVDCPGRPNSAGWTRWFERPGWGQLTVRQDRDLRLTYIVARMAEAPLEIVPASAAPSGRLTAPVSEIAHLFERRSGRTILGAVNGGFFDMRTGLPIGFLLRDGMMEFFNMPQGIRRSMVGFTRGRSGRGGQVVVSSPDRMPKVWLEAWRPGEEARRHIPVHHINVPGGKDAFSLFTAQYPGPLAARPEGVYVQARVVRSGRPGRTPVYEVMGRWRIGGPVEIPPGGLVIALHGGARRLDGLLKPGTRVRPQWSLPEEWRRQEVVHGLLAGPRLLERGELRVTAEAERLATLRSGDRMAIGVRSNGEAIFLWAHRSGVGADVPFTRLAQELASLGAVEGIALDGGNSRGLMAMGWNASHLERFVEAGRPVSNALVVSLLPESSPS